MATITPGERAKCALAPAIDNPDRTGHDCRRSGRRQSRLQKPKAAVGTSAGNIGRQHGERRPDQARQGGRGAHFRVPAGRQHRQQLGGGVRGARGPSAIIRGQTFVEQVTNANNETVPSRVSVARGSKPWRKVEAKMFLFANETARYGFRLSHENGSLPPAFQAEQRFTFGFVVERADDLSNRKPANN